MIVLIGNYGMMLFGPYSLFDITSLSVLGYDILLQDFRENWRKMSMDDVRGKLKAILPDLKKDNLWEKGGLSKYNIELKNGLSGMYDMVKRPTKELRGSSVITPYTMSHFVIHFKSTGYKVINTGVLDWLPVKKYGKFQGEVLKALCEVLETWDPKTHYFRGYDWKVDKGNGRVDFIKNYRAFFGPRSTDWKKFGKSYVSLYLSYNLGLLDKYFHER